MREKERFNGTQMLRHYLLQRRQLLFEVVQSLQQLPLLQQVVLGQVERRVQQMHNMLHVHQLHGMLIGCSHCGREHNKAGQDEKAGGVVPGEIITAIYQQGPEL